MYLPCCNKSKSIYLSIPYSYNSLIKVEGGIKTSNRFPGSVPGEWKLKTEASMESSKGLRDCPGEFQSWALEFPRALKLKFVIRCEAWQNMHVLIKRYSLLEVMNICEN